MMEQYFNAISEQTQPGRKWQQLFNTYWPAYQAWLNNAKWAGQSHDLKVAQNALKIYMPEMLPIYERFCQLAGNDAVAARFLTGYRPPAYISGCSQAVSTSGKIQLVRNYDYHPALMEGTLLMSAWHGKRVMANSDCLIGAVDGMNEDGLAISLAFGGRKVVGDGFGIPFILRYVLEFCSNVKEAVEALFRIPSHMSYNVTVIDRSGAFKTIQLAPDRSPLITDAAFTTNHQGVVEWPENAAFNRTVERLDFLEHILSAKAVDSESVVQAFRMPPLYSTRYEEHFGTLYTAVYYPVEGKVTLHWPNQQMQQTFESFQEANKLITFHPLPTVPLPASTLDVPVITPSDLPANGGSRKSRPQWGRVYWEKLLDYGYRLRKALWGK